MKKILCACGNGMGSSLIIKIRVEQILNKLGIEGKVESTSVSEASGIANQFDVVLCSNYLVKDFPIGKTKVIGLMNLLDANEIEKSLKEAFNV